MKKIIPMAIVLSIFLSVSYMFALQKEARSSYGTWDLFYDADVLPENFDPPFATLWPPHIDNHQYYIKETSEGMLHISTLFPDLEPWYMCCAFHQDWDANLSIGFTVEVRVKLIRHLGWMGGGMGVMAGDYESEIVMILNPDRVFEGWSGNEFAMNTTDDFHTYRIAVLRNEYWIYIDNVLRIQGKTGTYNRTGTCFGDLSNLANAEAFWDYVAFTTKGAFSPAISASLDINPDTLNLKSHGEWITGYIELPEGYDVNDINVSTILLNDTIPAEMHPTTIGDEDGDSIPDLMVKFDRALVIDYIENNIDWWNPERTKPLIYQVTLTITGMLYDGTLFEGSDTIRALKFLKGQPQPK